MSKAELTQEDLELFNRAVAGTKPLKQTNIVVFDNHANTTISQQQKLRRNNAIGNNNNSSKINISDIYASLSLYQDDSQYLKSGHSRGILKDLRRLKWPIQANIDLHGYNTDQARTKLLNFLNSCLEHNIRCVLIVHGKGYGSIDSKPVLKNLVRKWLTQIENVIAYTQSPISYGGSGAILVLLKSNTKY